MANKQNWRKNRREKYLDAIKRLHPRARSLLMAHPNAVGHCITFAANSLMNGPREIHELADRLSLDATEAVCALNSLAPEE